MEVLIFKTNINSKDEFMEINNQLSRSFDMQDCSIDLEDHDKVLRIVSDYCPKEEVINQVNNLGFLCQEMTW